MDNDTNITPVDDYVNVNGTFVTTEQYAHRKNAFADMAKTRANVARTNEEIRYAREHRWNTAIDNWCLEARAPRSAGHQPTDVSSDIGANDWGGVKPSVEDFKLLVQVIAQIKPEIDYFAITHEISGY
jgi:hypothetical protein